MRGWLMATGTGLLVGLAACVGTIGGTDDAPPVANVPTTEVPEPLVARLTDFQYRFAMEDVFGVTLTTDEVAKLPRDIPIEAHYSTNVEGQIFDQQFVIAYAEISRSVTARLDPSSLLSEFGDCSDQTTACLETFIAGLGLRLFRRPTTPEEVAVFAALADDVTTFDTASFDDGVVAVTQAMLQAPSFLYRLEDETTGTPDTVRFVSAYELASRLSFFLWQSLPDPKLLAWAAAVPPDGAIDEGSLAAEVDRMMADPRYARARDLFWLDYTLLSTASFPFADPAVAGELRDSLLRTLNELSGTGGEPGRLTDLFILDQLWMTPAVADLAGATSTQDGMASYATADLEQRIGITTHPGFLGAIGTTSFVGRGLFMSKRLLCLTTSPPPSDENAFNRIQETAQATEDLTPREASQFRFNLEPACQGCHQLFEPIAYAYERYDLSAQYTLTDDAGRDLFTDGVLPPGPNRPEIQFDDVFGLMSELAQTEGVARCLVENMLEYATMHPARAFEDALETASGVFDDNGGTFDALVRAVALNPQLRRQRIMAEEEGSP